MNSPDGRSFFASRLEALFYAAGFVLTVITFLIVFVMVLVGGWEAPWFRVVVTVGILGGSAFKLLPRRLPPKGVTTVEVLQDAIQRVKSAD